MAYFDTVEQLKQIIDGYSAESDKLSALYKSALEKAEDSYKEQNELLEKRYQRDRNEAYSDVARDKRNAFNMLASRGLGFSGEAAQVGLNSNLLLNERLAEITRGRAEAEQALLGDFEGKKQSLTLEQMKNQGLLDDRRNGLLEGMLALESEREQAEKDRESEKELLAIKAEQTRELETALLAQKLKAEKEMQRAELDAKYGSGGSSSSGGTGSGGSSSGGSSSSGNVNVSGSSVPTLDAKELAKLVIQNSTDGNYVRTKDEEYRVNKYIVDLIDSYKPSDEYMQELLFMLRAYGYRFSDINTVRNSVISYDAKALYSQKYGEYYDKYIVNGSHELTAGLMATENARNEQLDYIFDRVSSKEQFKSVCSSAGIPNSYVEEYLNSVGDESGSRGSVGLKGAIRRETK